MTRAASRLLAAVCTAAIAFGVHGCGSSLTDAQRADLRRQLRDAMAAGRDARRTRRAEQLLADIVDKDVLDGLNQEQLRAALGTGKACRTELCESAGIHGQRLVLRDRRGRRPRGQATAGADRRLRPARARGARLDPDHSLSRMAEVLTRQDARGLVPLEAPPEDRPRAASQACEACGTLLDPLRASVVLAFEDAYRYLCNADCERDFRMGARQRRAPTPISQRAAGPVPTPLRNAVARGVPLATPPLPEQAARGLWFGAVAAFAAMIVGVMASAPGPALLAAVLCCVAAATALWATWPLIADVGWPGAWGRSARRWRRSRPATR